MAKKEEIKEVETVAEDKTVYELTQEEIKKLNLFQKMDLVRVYTGVVSKNIQIGMGKGYKAVSETDILKAVNEAEHKARLVSYQDSLEIIESNTAQSKYIRVKSNVKVVNIDNPEEFVIFSGLGDGIDPNDKACGKANTYAMKYALMRGYKIPTGEDPDYFASEVPAEQEPQPSEELATEEDVKEWESIIGAEKIESARKSYNVNSLTELPRDLIRRRIEVSKKKQAEFLERQKQVAQEQGENNGN